MSSAQSLLLSVFIRVIRGRTPAWWIGRTFGVAFSRDGTLAAALAVDGQMVVWDVD
jgi:hypothetical protein